MRSAGVILLIINDTAQDQVTTIDVIVVPQQPPPGADGRLIQLFLIDLRTNFLEIEANPAITFLSKRIERAGTGYQATGDLHGVTHELCSLSSSRVRFQHPQPPAVPRYLTKLLRAVCVYRRNRIRFASQFSEPLHIHAIDLTTRVEPERQERRAERTVTPPRPERIVMPMLEVADESWARLYHESAALRAHPQSAVHWMLVLPGIALERQGRIGAADARVQ